MLDLKRLLSILLAVVVSLAVPTVWAEDPVEEDQEEPGVAIRRMILVAFPATFSATVVDSLK